MPAEFRQRVIDALATVEAGTVVSYGDLAAQAGYPGAGRGVGAVLAGSGSGSGGSGGGSSGGRGLTWWRVVYADGRLVPHIAAEHARLLRAEGVDVRNGRVVLPPTS